MGALFVWFHSEVDGNEKRSTPWVSDSVTLHTQSTDSHQQLEGTGAATIISSAYPRIDFNSINTE
jgi:hypothetical protein